MKINTIQFCDYRAFYNGAADEYLIKLDGKNLLVYGENGSGKTSLFRGLRDLVTGAEFVPHNQAKGANEGFVKIVLDDGSEEALTEAGGKTARPELLNTGRLNSFLSYKEILRIHLLEKGETTLNLFPLFAESLLAHHEIEDGVSLLGVWNNLKGSNPEVEKHQIYLSLKSEQITKEEADELIEALPKDYDERIQKFKDLLSVLLTEIEDRIKTFLVHFDRELEISFSPPEIQTGDIAEGNINLEVKYLGIDIQDYPEFLNEARLSAIALSIYFAAIASNPTANALKILVLDDVFIGLDTGNRSPLMDILKAPPFNEWQIILTTYDRGWFELAKMLLSGWETVEMYRGTKDGVKCDCPVIIRPSNSHLERALKYRNAKDYPAAANYLRKAIEQLIKERLPDEKKADFGEKPKMLSTLWEILVGRYGGLNHPIPDDVKEYLSSTRLTLINPQSHDNLSAPVYESELKRGFELIDKIADLPVIHSIVIAQKGMKVKFRHPMENYTFEFELHSGWSISVLNDGGNEEIPHCRILKWQYNNTDFWDFRNNRSLTARQQESACGRTDSLSKVITNLVSTPLNITEDIFYNNSFLESGMTLGQLNDWALDFFPK